MRNILKVIFLLCFSLSFAQLSVRNNAYVFVNDEVLFVEDAVNLEESTARLYLRSEAQLLQGNGTTGNSGIGELSVYQDGTVNQWSYNYWCAPVGNSLANSTGNRTFRFNQIDDPRLDTTTDVIDSSNPTFTGAVNGDATTTPITISTYWTYTFVSSDQLSQWSYAGGATDDINPGLGYTMKGMGTGTTGNQTYDFRGKPNNGTITNPVASGNFTLVGNPYPSALDSAAYIHDTDNIAAITGTLFYWEQDGTIASHVLADYIGGYSEFTINAAGDMITTAPAVFFTYDAQGNALALPPPGANGTKLARRYIPIAQGFMVEGSVGTSGTVTTKNSHRAYEKEGTNSFFFRNVSNAGAKAKNNDGIQYQDNGLTIIPSDYKRFRINVDFTVGSNQYTRQLVFNFHDMATMGFDYGLELSRSNNYPTDAYFSLDNKAYSGQAYPFDESLAIPLVIDIEAQQPLRFRILDIQNFEASQDIFLHDIENDLYVNLRQQDYELNIDPGNYTDRFEVVFVKSQVLNTDDFEVSKLTIRQDNDRKQLNVLNPNGLDIKSVEVFDIAGKLMLNNSYDSVLNRYKISTTDISDGVYIVNVTADDNTAKSQKVIVKQ